MKRAARIAWSISLPTLVGVLLFFFLVAPARAPYGGKNSLGGRTIASLQEEEFDHRILQMQHCYGIRFQAERATLERRRVCKALVVHHLTERLAKPGTFLRAPIEFRCEDTAFARKPTSEEVLSIAVLKPNAEFQEIENVLTKEMDMIAAEETEHRYATETCRFLTECKWAMRPQAFSFRKLASCLGTDDVMRRKILVDEIASMIFRVRSSQKKGLYTELVREAQK